MQESESHDVATPTSELDQRPGAATRNRVNRRHSRLGAETLESRRLLTIGLSTEPVINAFAGVGFALNPVTEIDGVFNGVQDNNPGDYHVQINWGDGTASDGTAELLAVSNGVLVKGSHVYQVRRAALITRSP